MEKKRFNPDTYTHTPAPQKIDGVNQGIRLLQRRVYQYKPANGGGNTGSGGASGTSNYPTQSRYETGSYGFRPLEDFFTWNFTPSSDNTAIRLYFRWHGGFGYRGINVYLKGGNQGHTNDVPSYGWTSGDQNGEWWYNSWGKDVEAEIRFEVHGASHNNTGIDEGIMWTDAPMLLIEEWENGNPNGQQVEFWTGPRDIGESASGGHNPTRPHPRTNNVGKSYAYDPDRWDGGEYSNYTYGQDELIIKNKNEKES